MEAIPIPKLTESQLKVRLENSRLGDNKLIMAALEQANLSHKDARRDDGTSYLEQHIYPVCASLIDYFEAKGKTPAPEIIAAALLHDVLEDDPLMTDAEFREKFGEELYSIVKPLTKDKEAYKSYPGADRQEKIFALNRDYIHSLESAPEGSKLIKLADRLNNLSCCHALSSEKRIRYIKETEELFLPLAKRRSAYFYGKLKYMIEQQQKQYMD